jgi:hypothetical protein
MTAAAVTTMTTTRTHVGKIHSNDGAEVPPSQVCIEVTAVAHRENLLVDRHHVAEPGSAMQLLLLVETQLRNANIGGMLQRVGRRQRHLAPDARIAENAGWGWHRSGGGCRRLPLLWWRAGLLLLLLLLLLLRRRAGDRPPLRR